MQARFVGKYEPQVGVRLSIICQNYWIFISPPVWWLRPRFHLGGENTIIPIGVSMADTAFWRLFDYPFGC
jgi:hypothetical protein